MKRCEWTAEEWAARKGSLRKVEAVHGCGDEGKHYCHHVFRCRGKHHSCGRYFGSCLGGDDDNRCCDCWVKFQEAEKAKLKERLVRYVSGSHFRFEDAMCKRFGEYGTDDSSDVEDALFELVKEGKLEWFGAEEDGSKPLRYRLPRKVA